MNLPGIRDGRRMIYAGASIRKLGTCPEPAPFFCCTCRIWTLPTEYFCMPCSAEWYHDCIAEPGCEGYPGTEIPCPTLVCDGQKNCNPWGRTALDWISTPNIAPAIQPANPGRIGVQVTFSELRTTLLDSSAELLADPNRSLRCAMLSSLPDQALFVGTDADAVEVQIFRKSPPTLWFLYAYALTRVGGERYRLLFFQGGGSSWRNILEGETVRIPNRATTSGNQAGILADPSGWAEIRLDRTARASVI